MKKLCKVLMVILSFMFISFTATLAVTINPNTPVLVSGMTPVKLINGEWTATNKYDLDWYNYENKKWANAQTADGSLWVWIPRYTYKISGVDVSIKWSHGVNDDLSDGYISHSAFKAEAYIGGNPNEASSYKNKLPENELTGFWVAKYLASASDTGNIQSKAGVVPDISKNIGEAFNSCLNMKDVESYNINSDGVSTHLTKASEWGAVSYLTKSYGRFPEENATGYTGTDKSQSTTHNAYGVYDMNGLTDQYVSALVIKESLNENAQINVGNMLREENEKYVDVVNLTSTDTSLNNETALQNYFGFSVSETKNFVLGDIENIPTSSTPYFAKGGSNVGLFGYNSTNGSGLGFRPVISIATSYLSGETAFFDTAASVVAGDYLILSVNFSVDEDWRFALNSGEKIIENGEIVSGKEKRIFDFVDLRYVQNNETLTLSNANLNEHLISIIEDDKTIQNLNDETRFSANKQYTLRVRIGGYNEDDEPVLLAIPGMTSKIVVNKIEVKSANNNSSLKVASIPNNKVRLEIYDTQGRTPILTSVKLISAPSKRDYYFGEKLSLAGGKIEVSYGDNIAELDLKEENIENYGNVTRNVGNDQLINLIYSGIEVDQSETEYRINVSGNERYNVSGIVSPIGTASIVSGIGEYDKGSSVELKAVVYPGYKFKNWYSSDISIPNSSNLNTSFTMPANNVLVKAYTMGATSLEVVNPKLEFERGEAFELGDGNLVAHYADGDSEVVYLTSSGVTSIPSKNMILDTLGVQTVTVKYGGATCTYDINVVKEKYNLTIYTNNIDGGFVQENGETIVPVDSENMITKRVSYDESISFLAVNESSYTFQGWDISLENIVTEEKLANTDITFTMPKDNLILIANFIKTYNINYSVNNELYGVINGSTVQVIKHGEDASEVTAVASEGYRFKKWNDNRSTEKRLDQYITQNSNYVAEFVKTWTVTFIANGTTFATKTVDNGGNGNISEIPTKYGYVFSGWNQDLEYVLSDVTAEAIFLPRIEITPNGSIEQKDLIDAHITGRGIKYGTLEYIISDSQEYTGESVSNYHSDGTFNFEGSWEVDSENPELYRSYAQLASKQDSSTTITIYSNKIKEIIKFNYMVSVTSGQQLGITVNGERINSPTDAMNTWHIFNNEVNVVDGKIIIGISYSQDSVYAETDFGAIKDLKTGRHWTTIDSEYDLTDRALWANNYVHIRGIDADDGTTVYTLVSETFKGTSLSSDEYLITYDLGGGIVTNPSSYNALSSPITLNNPSKPKYTFIGWTGSNGDTPETEVIIPTGSTGNKRYIANWVLTTYTITVTQGANGTISPGTTVIYEGNSVTFSIANNTGYHISDVLVDNSSIGVVTSYTFNNVIANHMITAVYEINTYAIAVTQGNNGVISANSVNVNYGETQTFTITPNAGYEIDTVTVDGISIEVTNSLTSMSYTFSNVKETHAITATYKVYITYTVSYNANGGSGAPSSQTKIHGVGLILSSTGPTRAGYTFKGWNTSSSGNGTDYVSGATYTTNANATLYAKWGANNYTVTFNPNGGSVGTTSKTVTYNSAYGTLPIPSRSSYDFEGWYTSSSSGTYKSSTSTVTTASNHILYAHWSERYSYCDCCGGNYYNCPCSRSMCSCCGYCTNCCTCSWCSDGCGSCIVHSSCSCPICSCCGVKNCSSCYGSYCSVCGQCANCCPGNHTQTCTVCSGSGNCPGTPEQTSSSDNYICGTCGQPSFYQTYECSMCGCTGWGHDCWTCNSYTSSDNHVGTCPGCGGSGVQSI